MAAKGSAGLRMSAVAVESVDASIESHASEPVPERAILSQSERSQAEPENRQLRKRLAHMQAHSSQQARIEQLETELKTAERRATLERKQLLSERDRRRSASQRAAELQQRLERALQERTGRAPAPGARTAVLIDTPYRAWQELPRTDPPPTPAGPNAPRAQPTAGASEQQPQPPPQPQAHGEEEEPRAGRTALEAALVESEAARDGLTFRVNELEASLELSHSELARAHARAGELRSRVAAQRARARAQAAHGARVFAADVRELTGALVHMLAGERTALLGARAIAKKEKGAAAQQRTALEEAEARARSLEQQLAAAGTRAAEATQHSRQLSAQLRESQRREQLLRATRVGSERIVRAPSAAAGLPGGAGATDGRVEREREGRAEGEGEGVAAARPAAARSERAGGAPPDAAAASAGEEDAPSSPSRAVQAALGHRGAEGRAAGGSASARERARAVAGTRLALAAAHAALRERLARALHSWQLACHIFAERRTRGLLMAAQQALAAERLRLRQHELALSARSSEAAERMQRTSALQRQRLLSEHQRHEAALQRHVLEAEGRAARLSGALERAVERVSVERARARTPPPRRPAPMPRPRAQSMPPSPAAGRRLSIDVVSLVRQSSERAARESVAERLREADTVSTAAFRRGYVDGYAREAHHAHALPRTADGAGLPSASVRAGVRAGARWLHESRRHTHAHAHVESYAHEHAARLELGGGGGGLVAAAARPPAPPGSEEEEGADTDSTLTTAAPGVHAEPAGAAGGAEPGADAAADADAALAAAELARRRSAIEALGAHVDELVSRGARTMEIWRAGRAHAVLLTARELRLLRALAEWQAAAFAMRHADASARALEADLASTRARVSHASQHAALASAEAHEARSAHALLGAALDEAESQARSSSSAAAANGVAAASLRAELGLAESLLSTEVARSAAADTAHAALARALRASLADADAELGATSEGAEHTVALLGHSQALCAALGARVDALAAERTLGAAAAAEAVDGQSRRASSAEATLSALEGRVHTKAVQLRARSHEIERLQTQLRAAHEDASAEGGRLREQLLRERTRARAEAERHQVVLREARELRTRQLSLRRAAGGSLARALRALSALRGACARLALLRWASAAAFLQVGSASATISGLHHRLQVARQGQADANAGAAHARELLQSALSARDVAEDAARRSMAALQASVEERNRLVAELRTREVSATQLETRVLASQIEQTTWHQRSVSAAAEAADEADELAGSAALPAVTHDDAIGA